MKVRYHKGRNNPDKDTLHLCVSRDGNSYPILDLLRLEVLSAHYDQSPVRRKLGAEVSRYVLASIWVEAAEIICGSPVNGEPSVTGTVVVYIHSQAGMRHRGTLP